jgi:mono/diheme cytochrome c family protein
VTLKKTRGRNSSPLPTKRTVRKQHLGMWMLVLLFALTACSGDAATEQQSPEQGASIYAENCQVCHGDAATGSQATLGAPTHGPEGHTWHHADGQLVQIIFGKLDFPGKTMPSFEGVLSQRDVLDVLAYLKSNWPAEQLEFQAEVSKNWQELQGSP